MVEAVYAEMGSIQQTVLNLLICATVPVEKNVRTETVRAHKMSNFPV